MRDSESLVGLSASEFLCKLPHRCPAMSILSFLKYRPRPGFVERLSCDWVHERRLGKSVESYLAGLTRAADWSSEIVQDLLTESFHHEPAAEPRYVTKVKSSELKLSLINRMRKSMSSDQVLAVASVCWDDQGRKRHVPMMDMAVQIDEKAIGKLSRVLRQLLDCSGVILKSGRSYHCYWFTLLTTSSWTKFMSKSILFQPIVDSRYVAHRLLGNRCVLRISANDMKPTEPVVVAEF